MRCLFEKGWRYYIRVAHRAKKVQGCDVKLDNSAREARRGEARVRASAVCVRDRRKGRTNVGTNERTYNTDRHVKCRNFMHSDTR